MRRLKFGFSKKDRKRATIRQNQAQGKMREAMYEMGARASGKEVIRTGRGHDYKERERDPWTGKVKKTRYVEVKSSRKAPVSKLQKKMKKKYKGRYVVDRPMF